MTRSASDRSRLEAFLAYDLAVLSWLDGLGPPPVGLEPSDSPTSTGDEHSKRPGCLVGFDEAGRERTPGPTARLVGFDEAGRERTPRPTARLVGFDEAGRGALAGPVVVGCVLLDLNTIVDPAQAGHLGEALLGVDDSKRLAVAKRDRLFEKIAAHARSSVGAASAVEIDCVGIVTACRRASCRAYRNLGVDAAFGLFDRGLSLRGAGDAARPPSEASAVGADRRSLHVACASIVAKVWRDRRMCRLAEAFPDYGFERHKGYGTPAHRAAIEAVGPTSIHRRSFLRGGESAKSPFC